MRTLQQPTYDEVKCLYEALRRKSRQITLEGLPPTLSGSRGIAICREDISMHSMTPECMHQLKRWEASGNRRVAWDWNHVRKNYRAKPKRFEVSIWYRKTRLGGVAIGKPTWSGGKLRLDFIEANPLGTALDGLITDIIIRNAIIYAETLGASQIRIMKPINDKVKEHYLSKQGFHFDSQNNFCYRDLK